VKRPFGRPRHRLEASIKIFLMDTGMQRVDWIHLAEVWDLWKDLVKMIMNPHIQ
jgi:hypothetical protein